MNRALRGQNVAEVAGIYGHRGGHEPLLLTYRLGLHRGVMSDTAVEQRTTNAKADEWAERIAAQQRTKM